MSTWSRLLVHLRERLSRSSLPGPTRDSTDDIDFSPAPVGGAPFVDDDIPF